MVARSYCWLNVCKGHFPGCLNPVLSCMLYILMTSQLWKNISSLQVHHSKSFINLSGYCMLQNSKVKKFQTPSFPLKRHSPLPVCLLPEICKISSTVIYIHVINMHLKIVLFSSLIVATLPVFNFQSWKFLPSLPVVALHGGCPKLYSYLQAIRVPASSTQRLINSFDFCQAEGKVVPHSLKLRFCYFA